MTCRCTYTKCFWHGAGDNRWNITLNCIATQNNAREKVIKNEHIVLRNERSRRKELSLSFMSLLNFSFCIFYSSSFAVVIYAGTRNSSGVSRRRWLAVCAFILQWVFRFLVWHKVLQHIRCRTFTWIATFKAVELTGVLNAMNATSLTRSTFAVNTERWEREAVWIVRVVISLFVTHTIYVQTSSPIKYSFPLILSLYLLVDKLLRSTFYQSGNSKEVFAKKLFLVHISLPNTKEWDQTAHTAIHSLGQLKSLIHSVSCCKQLIIYLFCVFTFPFIPFVRQNKKKPLLRRKWHEEIEILSTFRLL